MTEMTTAGKTVRTDAGTIEYTDIRSGPVLVFLHGVLMAGDVWQPVVERLADTFRCVLPTLPLGAHRVPARADADLSVAGSGRLVHQVIDALDLRDFRELPARSAGQEPPAPVRRDRGTDRGHDARTVAAGGVMTVLVCRAPRRPAVLSRARSRP